ncbi:hypothetical protein P167DRAFT_432586 [Morchella conica CCBAS932]|uniref:Uncharacterized protein n=1 Tax=Morchella conica CCBAS932 TaxID=1392247 RepID=A0A3N4L192_9PEZI|nr:hypothetical protein P167DRAFT_432586 [Morchella conica CCBAS932]
MSFPAVLAGFECLSFSDASMEYWKAHELCLLVGSCRSTPVTGALDGIGTQNTTPTQTEPTHLATFHGVNRAIMLSTRDHQHPVTIQRVDPSNQASKSKRGTPA